MHGDSRYGLAPADFREEYYGFRQAICTADLLMEIAHSDNGVLISRTPDSLKDAPNSGFTDNFDLPLHCGGSVDAFNNTGSLTIDPLTNLIQRTDVREMAFRSYYTAFANAMVFTACVLS
jgi:hypothetical protein